MRNMKNGNFLIKLGGHRRLLTLALVAILAVSTFMFALPHTSLKAKAAGNDLISNAACSGSYTFSTSNSGSYFVNQATYAAYKAPANNSDGDAHAQGMADLISGVFDHTFTGDMGYKYANGTISLYTKFTSLTDENFSSTSVNQTDVVVTQTAVGHDFLQFPGLSAAISTYTSGGGQLSNLLYTYNDSGTLTIMKEHIIDTSNTLISSLDEVVIISMLGKFNSGFTFGNLNASEIPYAVFAEVAGSTAHQANANGREFYQAEIDAATTIINVIYSRFAGSGLQPTELSQANIKIVYLDGSGGLRIIYSQFPDSSTVYQRQADWSSSAYANGFSLSSSAPTYIFRNTNEYGKSYFVPGNSLTGNFSGSDTGVVNFLKAVFPAATGVAFNTSTSYSMSISQTGSLTISAPIQTAPSISTAFPIVQEISAEETVDDTPEPDYLDALMKMLEEAKEAGGPQTVYWSEGTALPGPVMKFLSENPQITLIFSYTYQGLDYTVTLPGKNVKYDPNVPWCGPLYLYGLYGRYSASTPVKTTNSTLTLGNRTYTITSGDSLWDIARRLGITVDELVRINNVKNPDKIDIGQIIRY